jgi:D-beta-D-heptose 7-phosphate kinase/D-beta-D-heptose 1-phosphate adenosyltransferase
MSSSSTLTAQVDRLDGARVLCVGDVMLDRFVYGNVQRISPEAPIPVLAVEREVAMLGGAGNVVRNLVALGAESCFISVVGNDAAGREVTSLLAAESRIEPHVLIDNARRTTIKTRFVAGTQQLLRADRETVSAVAPETATDLLRRATLALSDHKVLVLSDYDKGVLRDGGTETLIAAAKTAGTTIVVDPKGRQYGRYRGADILTPNRRELAEATGLPTDTLDLAEIAAQALIAAHEIGAVLVTLSQDGMLLVRPGVDAIHLPAVAREVFDVSGAGDTVVATLAASLAGGLPIETAAALANIAAGIVVAKIGTAVADAAEIVTALQTQELAQDEVKVLGQAKLLEAIARWRRAGLKIGFTNGCFDLLHPGHISLLSQARAACDRLVVGLNSDASVSRLKGPTRPIQNEMARAVVLASLAHVDAVTLFAEDTPLALITAIRPDVLVKGADYTKETVVGADVVESYGGQVVLAKLTPGQSTTAMVAKISG